MARVAVTTMVNNSATNPLVYAIQSPNRVNQRGKCNDDFWILQKYE